MKNKMDLNRQKLQINSANVLNKGTQSPIGTNRAPARSYDSSDSSDISFPMNNVSSDFNQFLLNTNSRGFHQQNTNSNHPQSSYDLNIHQSTPQDSSYLENTNNLTIPWQRNPNNSSKDSSFLARPPRPRTLSQPSNLSNESSYPSANIISNGLDINSTLARHRSIDQNLFLENSNNNNFNSDDINRLRSKSADTLYLLNNQNLNSQSLPFPEFNFPQNSRYLPPENQNTTNLASNSLENYDDTLLVTGQLQGLNLLENSNSNTSFQTRGDVRGELNSSHVRASSLTNYPRLYPQQHMPMVRPPSNSYDHAQFVYYQQNNNNIGQGPNPNMNSLNHQNAQNISKARSASTDVLPKYLAAPKSGYLSPSYTSVVQNPRTLNEPNDTKFTAKKNENVNNALNNKVARHVYIVKFKRSQRSFFLGHQNISSSEQKNNLANINVGQYVKVEADRGEDLGIVISRVPLEKYRLRLSNSNDSSEDLSTLKKILRVATHDEISLLTQKRNEEDKLLQICRQKVKQRNLQMRVVDAEYQFDRNKLTFFFESLSSGSGQRIDFRELVRDLFSVYKTRIWMQQIDKGSSSNG